MAEVCKVLNLPMTIEVSTHCPVLLHAALLLAWAKPYLACTPGQALLEGLVHEVPPAGDPAG